MAKQITQETFDVVVKENMQEFDMSSEEAIADAVSQFEAQVIEIGTEHEVGVTSILLKSN